MNVRATGLIARSVLIEAVRRREIYSIVLISVVMIGGVMASTPIPAHAHWRIILSNLSTAAPIMTRRVCNECACHRTHCQECAH